MMENKTKIDLKNKSVFITGAAGFIGSNLAKRLLSTVEGVKVVGLDNMNHYYVIGLTAAGKTSFFYVDKDRLVRFNGFFPKPQSGTYLILDEGGYQVAGQKGTWLVSDEVEVDGQRFVQMRSEQTKSPPPSIILHESGAFMTQTALGFDGEATRKMRTFLQGPKPELLHHQKFFENGTAERAKESGTEQNYNMIDGCVNNVPKKPRRIGGRWSVLDRLHIKQAERRQKDNTPQQEQERSRKS